MYGQMTAGSLDLHRHARASCRARTKRSPRPAASTTAGLWAARWILTRGTGRHGRRAAARGDVGRRDRSLTDRVPAVSLDFRLRSARYLDEQAQRPRRRAARSFARHCEPSRRRVDRRCSATRRTILPELVKRAKAGGAARPRHRPDVRARSRQRLSAGRLDASSAGRRRSADPATARVAGVRRRAVAAPCTCDAMLDVPRDGRRRRSTTATTSGRSRSTEGVAERVRISRASCPRTSGRCSARARDRSAGSRCQAIRRTSTRPTRKIKQLFPHDAHRAPLARHGARSASRSRACPRASAGSGLGERHRAGLAFNEMVKSGRAEGTDRDRPRPSGHAARSRAPTARPRAWRDGIRRGVRLAAAQRAPQHRRRLRRGCRSITAAASAWATRSTRAW